MAAWLSYWNITRRRNERRLGGEPASKIEIYVPWGWDPIKLGDTIYCFFIERGDVHLIMSVKATARTKDPDHNESVSITPSPSDRVQADFERVIPGPDLSAIRYVYADGITTRDLTNPDPRRFHGRASIRELVAGTAQLNKCLASKSTP